MEIEIRGPIKNKRKIKKTLRKLALKDQQIRLFQIIVFFKKNNQDFRIKWNKNKPYFEFVYKSKKGKQRRVREEIEIKINKNELDEFLSLLEILGFKEGFVSSTDRIDITTANIGYSFKFGTVIGDYWEAEANEKLKSKYSNNKKKILSYLITSIEKLTLPVWSEDEFRRIRHQKWAKIKPVPIKKLKKLLKNFDEKY